ncbi:hypothetical protein BC829DRAFT_142647 [Chytridium lagenaria]|nr:hypothetical protein BC829DRAFT_142647 [Chytridium lagenaria]
MWWKTTEVHRAPLPFAQMQQASSSIFNTSFHVNLDLAIRDTVTVDHKAFAASVDEKLHRIFALQAESGGTHFVFHVNARSIEKDSYAGDSIAKNGNYIVGIACDLTNLEGQSPITGKVHADRLLEIQFHSDCSSEHITDEVALTIGGLFREEQKEFSTSSLQKTDTLENMREVQFSPEEALDVYLKPFLQSVSSLSHFEVVSQITTICGASVRASASVGLKQTIRVYSASQRSSPLYQFSGMELSIGPDSVSVTKFSCLRTSEGIESALFGGV